MAWEGSTRRARLPSDWNRRRAYVLERDGYRCTVVQHDTRCTERATEVDHIVRGDNHSYSNLAAICTWHHRKKTAAEAAAARRSRTTSRAPEPHPGLL